MKPILEVMDSVRLTLEETVSNEKLEEFDNAVQEMKTFLTNNPRVVLFLDGGLVQEMYTDRPAEILKIDLDTEGADESELETYPDRSGTENSGYISLERTEKAPYSIAAVDEDYVNTLFEKLNHLKED